MSARPADPECGHRLDRRTFLQQASGFAAAVLVGLGAPPSTAAQVAEVRAGNTEPDTARERVRTYALPVTDGALVDADSEVLLVRWGGRVFAFALGCPHRGTIVRWQGSGAFCPKHKARFAPDGTNVGGRRTRALDRYPIRRVGAQVTVDLSARLEQDADAAAWAAAWVPAG